MTKTYANRSNARRAAKAAADKLGNCTFEVIPMQDGTFGYELIDTTPEQPQHDGVDDITAYGEFGAGTAEAPACPHCGIDHKANGYNVGDEHEHVCLACGGEWGPVHASFAASMDAFKAAGNSKCKSLRLTAARYQELGDGREGNHMYTRKNFIADAMDYGIKETTASANWACTKRGEI